jgi:hypothetical protein
MIFTSLKVDFQALKWVFTRSRRFFIRSRRFSSAQNEFTVASRGFYTLKPNLRLQFVIFRRSMRILRFLRKYFGKIRLFQMLRADFRKNCAL